jgi:two-component system sensor histidine kinase HydH
MNIPSNPLSALGSERLITAESGPANGPAAGAVAAALAEQLPVAALIVDRTGAIELCNRAAQELLAIPAAELVGAPVSRILGRSPDVERALAAAQRGASGSAEIARGPDGELPLRLTVLPVPEHGGALVLAAARLPAPVEPEAPLARLAALGRISAGMAHELRNPLAGIGTNAEVLRRRLDPEDPGRRAVNFILEEVARLDRLIEELLQFARPPAPRLSHHDLRDSIERALALARSRIDAARVALRLRVEGEPPGVFVDPEQMVQVILNVILNAIQAMPEGGELGILLRTVERLGPAAGRAGRRADDPARGGPLRRFLELEVRDTGVGIPESDLAQVFEPFFTTRAAGTGLGLAVSQALVQQHGGAIAIESQLARGTTVTILIPVEKRRAPR